MTPVTQNGKEDLLDFKSDNLSKTYETNDNDRTLCNVLFYDCYSSNATDIQKREMPGVGFEPTQTIVHWVLRPTP